MVKTATVHAQQKWEYFCLTRKTEAYLVKELNPLGQEGWELVSVVYGRNVKNEPAWIAFLRRPYTGQGAPAAAQAGAAAAGQPENPAARFGKIDVSDESEGDEFELHEE